MEGSGRFLQNAKEEVKGQFQKTFYTLGPVEPELLFEWWRKMQSCKYVRVLCHNIATNKSLCKDIIFMLVNLSLGVKILKGLAGWKYYGSTLGGIPNP